MVPPLALVAILAAKKVVAFGIYRAVQRYGVARLYRRVLEANRRVTPAAHRVQVRKHLRSAFAFPEQAAAVLRDTWVWQLASKVVENRGFGVATNVPAAVWSAADILMKAGPAATEKVISEAARLAQRDAPSKETRPPLR